LGRAGDMGPATCDPDTRALSERRLTAIPKVAEVAKTFGDSRCEPKLLKGKAEARIQAWTNHYAMSENSLRF
jgi:hypothetical protein